MTREEFRTERTRIISEMLDNPDKYGIYPTTKCFEQLDALYDKILPPAEGAEEILKKHMNGRAVQEYKEELFIEYNTVVAAMQEFATIHAQRIAEKMVSERLREELIAYDKWMSSQKWGIRELLSPETTVNEYLKSRER